MARVSGIRTERQFSSYRWTQYGIISYGEDNAFPQAVNEIITASKTGNACLDIYNDFVYGMGFMDSETGTIVVNKTGLHLSKLLRFITADFTKFNGFCLHVNYNLNYSIRSIQFVPFENVRLCTPNDKGIITQVAVHPDWGHRDKYRSRWTPSEIEKIYVFNPHPDEIERQVSEAGSWEDYKGQILYFSGTTEGELAYPIPKYIAEVTDMRTEEGLANVTSRNVCSNFLLAGVFVDILEGGDQSKGQEDEKQRQLMEFQGDENTSQLWYMTAKSKEEVPVFVPFSGENYDKAFSQTQSVIPDNIGQAFKQPPILRAKDVGANFGADLMTNAYKFYNSVTVRERIQIQEVIEMLFSYWYVALDNPDFTIQPLTYNAGASIYERIGQAAMSMVMEIIRDTTLTPIQKRNAMKWGFGLSQEETLKLLPNDTDTRQYQEGEAGSGEPE